MRRTNHQPATTYFVVAPASCATAASVVCAAFNPRGKSLSECVMKRSAGADLGAALVFAQADRRDEILEPA